MANTWTRLHLGPEFWPPPGQWLEVCGDSGYVSQRWFIVNAIYERDAWYDATGTRLSECGWEPTHWRRMSSVPSEHPGDVDPCG